MQYNSAIKDTTAEITNFVSKLDVSEQKKILKALKIRQAKVLAKKLSAKGLKAEISIDEICATIRKIRQSNATLPTR